MLYTRCLNTTDLTPPRRHVHSFLLLLRSCTSISHMFMYQQCLSGWTSTHSTCPFCKAELNVVQPLPTLAEKAFRLFAAIMLLPLRHIARASAAADRRRDAAQRLTTSSDGTSAATSPSNCKYLHFRQDYSAVHTFICDRCCLV
jgi:hypothetical protein